MELRTQNEMIKHLQEANRVCKDDLKEITDNWNCGFLSTMEYLTQIRKATTDWVIKVGEIDPDDFNDVKVIVHYLEVNGLENKVK